MEITKHPDKQTYIFKLDRSKKRMSTKLINSRLSFFRRMVGGFASKDAEQLWWTYANGEISEYEYELTLHRQQFANFCKIANINYSQDEWQNYLSRSTIIYDGFNAESFK